MIFCIECNTCKKPTYYFTVKKVSFKHSDVLLRVCPACYRLPDAELERMWERSFASSSLFVWTVLGVLGVLAALVATACLLN